MIYQVLKATRENPSKNDFITTCQKYLKALKINISIEEIQTMSKYRFSKLLKDKIKSAAFLYLEEQQCKQEKIKDIKYSKLEMQEYLANGDRNIKVTRTIYKARGKTLDIKMHKKWKYEDTLCSGCKLNPESVEEILKCKYFEKN